MLVDYSTFNNDYYNSFVYFLYWWKFIKYLYMSTYIIQQKVCIVYNIAKSMYSSSTFRNNTITFIKIVISLKY